MKFAFYTGFAEKIQAVGPEKAVDYALSLGFSGVELLSSLQGGTEVLPDKAAGVLHRALQSRGLPMVCYSVYADLWHNPNAEALLLQKAELAAELECPYLHHTLFPTYHPGENDPGFEDALAKIADSAAKIASRAAQLGVTCLYEDQGAYFNSVQGYGTFLQAMKDRGQPVGVCADFGNILFVNEEPQDFIAAFGADVRHVHVKDYLRKTGERSPGLHWLRGKDSTWLRETMVGSGVVDVPACLQRLEKVGYGGYFALELCHPEPFEDGVRQAMDFLTQT